jgi:hypothetical protein
MHVIEVLQGYTVGAAPTGSFGVATTRHTVEALVTMEANARVSQHVIEALLTEGTEAGGGGGTVTYGFAT